MTTTTTTTANIINHANKFGAAAMHDWYSEGQTAALYHYATYIRGGMSESEFTELIEDASSKSDYFSNGYAAAMKMLIENL